MSVAKIHHVTVSCSRVIRVKYAFNYHPIFKYGLHRNKKKYLFWNNLLLFKTVSVTFLVTYLLISFAYCKMGKKKRRRVKNIIYEISFRRTPYNHARKIQLAQELRENVKCLNTIWNYAPLSWLNSPVRGICEFKQGLMLNLNLSVTVLYFVSDLKSLEASIKRQETVFNL